MTSSKAQKLCSVSKKRSSRPTLSHKKGAGRVQIWVSFGPRIPESMSWTHGNPKIYFLVGCSSFWKNRRLVNVHVHTYNIYRYRERYKSYKYNPFSNDMQFFWHGIIIRATLIIIKVQVINVNRTYTTDPLEKKLVDWYITIERKFSSLRLQYAANIMASNLGNPISQLVSNQTERNFIYSIYRYTMILEAIEIKAAPILADITPTRNRRILSTSAKKVHLPRNK